MAESTLGLRIRNIRKRNNMTQEDFGKIVGLHGSNVGRIEKDLLIPTADIVKKIALHFKISCDYIIMGESANMQTDFSPNTLANFRTLPPAVQAEIIEYIDFKFQRHQRSSRTNGPTPAISTADNNSNIV